MAFGGDRSRAAGRYQELFPDEDEVHNAPLPQMLDPTEERVVGELGVTTLDDGAPTRVIPNRYDKQPGNQWNHIEDPDSFFRKVYNYHQRHGFMCMAIENLLQLLQFLFVIVFVAFLSSCVDYAILAGDKPVSGHNATERVKVKLKDAISPPGQCIAGLSTPVRFCLIVALIFWLFRAVKVVFQLRQYLEVKHFYTTALHILPHELDNMTWYDVQSRLLEAQRCGEHKMVVQKEELTELDVYNRILRHENYLVALVNKNILPLELRLPFLGPVFFLSSGLKYNLEALLFWGPWAPFENNRKLKDDYKKAGRVTFLTQQLSKSMLYVGMLNIILLPLILVWQLLFVVFSYADVVKREPGFLGARMWSEYSRVHLRHLNELDHELNSRLCMGYRAATQYMNSFTSHITVIIARNGIFFGGSLWVVLVAITVWDEDFLAVEHIVTAIAGLYMVLAICRAAMPDEHMVWCPEQLMRTILRHIHYMPEHWKGQAHTTGVRDEFSCLFTYKLTHLLCEVLSPLVTPYVIMVPLRKESQRIVEFFCENTVTLPGVGDICSFAQMKLEAHGHPQWRAAAESSTDLLGESSTVPATLRAPPPSKQGEMGKTELSLVHFSWMNPKWNPDSQVGQKFLRGLSDQLEAATDHQEPIYLHDDNVQPNMTPVPPIPQGQVLSQSIHGFSSLYPMFSQLRPAAGANDTLFTGGGVTSAQGPLISSESLRALLSPEQSMIFGQSTVPTGSVEAAIQQSCGWPPMAAASSFEFSAYRMSASAVFLYERCQSNTSTATSASIVDYGTQQRRLYARPHSSGLANIQESRLETTPLLATSQGTRREDSHDGFGCV